jgi:putative oxidoreductase
VLRQGKFPLVLGGDCSNIIGIMLALRRAGRYGLFFILSGMLAVAYWQFHAPGGFWPTMNGGVPAALYCFVLLYISAAGAGPLSLDAMRGK